LLFSSAPADAEAIATGAVAEVVGSAVPASSPTVYGT
jgi:hypothetical protein